MLASSAACWKRDDSPEAALKIFNSLTIIGLLVFAAMLLSMIDSGVSERYPVYRSGSDLTSEYINSLLPAALQNTSPD